MGVGTTRNRKDVLGGEPHKNPLKEGNCNADEKKITWEGVEHLNGGGCVRTVQIRDSSWNDA